MRIPIWRILLLGFAVEVLAVATLAVLVAIFGPRDRALVQAYAEHLGQWVGPIASAVFCFLAAWWGARSILNGFLIGAVAVAIDLASLAPLGGSFGLLIAGSCAGRLVAGTLGGWVASTRRG